MQISSARSAIPTSAAEHAPGFLHRHGGFLRGLTADWAPLLGPAVAAEAHRVLGER